MIGNSFFCSTRLPRVRILPFGFTPSLRRLKLEQQRFLKALGKF